MIYIVIVPVVFMQAVAMSSFSLLGDYLGNEDVLMYSLNVFL